MLKPQMIGITIKQKTVYRKIRESATMPETT